MIKKLICWVWGCKTTCKAFTGETMHTNNGFVEHDSALYVWKKHKFCIRCGKEA